MSRNGETVTLFERELAAYCNAKFCVSASNGTVTLQAALIALGVNPGDRVATTPLSMSATTIAILNVGAVPVYVDVHPDTWLMAKYLPFGVSIPVSLYGLHSTDDTRGLAVVDDAAQTLRPHNTGAAFTSLSFQASKVLSCGEGGALLTNDESLAATARSYLSLGYAMKAGQARIDSSVIKSPTFNRHHLYPAINGRMNDLTAAEGLKQLTPYALSSSGRCPVDEALSMRRVAANRYRAAIDGVPWITQQRVPSGATHDHWTFAIACDTTERAYRLAELIVYFNGERPYGAWRLTFDETALKHLDPGPDACATARSLQPRLLQFQTNNLASAERNARALRLAIQEIGA